jgi:hypothetical protein
MEDLDTFLTTLSFMVDTLCTHHRLSRPKCPGTAPRLGVSGVITLTLFGQWSRFSHAMRNELVEELLIDPGNRGRNVGLFMIRQSPAILLAVR